MSGRRHDHDPQALWVVIQQTPAQPLVHSFPGPDAALAFSRAADGTEKSQPIALARTPLEQVSPLFVAAAQVALTALRSPATSAAQRDAAAGFLESCVHYARAEPGLADIYRETRKALLYGRGLADEPAAVIRTLQGHLEGKPGIGVTP